MVSMRRPAPFVRAALAAVAFVYYMGAGPPAVGTARGESWQGREEMRDGALHVLNPSTPSSAPKVVQAKELWQAGGEGENDVLFGVIAQIASDDQDTVYVLDSQLNQVVILSPDGALVRTIGREGEGPGEFRRPSDMFLTAEGNIAVMQRTPGKIVLLTPDGQPAGDLQIPDPADQGMRMFSGGQRAGENVVLSVSRFSRRDTGFEMATSLIAVGPSGDIRATYLENRDELDFAKMTIDEKSARSGAWLWAVGRDGRVFASDGFDAYRVQVWNPDGSLARVIEREYASRKRSPEEMKQFAPLVQIQQGDRAASPEIKVSETDRDIQQIFPRENGDLWVLSSKGAFDAPEGAVARFDVFDTNGRFTREVTVKGTGDYAADGIYLVNDKFYVVKGLRSARRAMLGGSEVAAPEEADAESIVVTCYEIGSPAQPAR